jgi:hypothetical protein
LISIEVLAGLCYDGGVSASREVLTAGAMPAEPFHLPAQAQKDNNYGC